MSTFVLIPQCRNEYSENLLSPNSVITDQSNIIKVSGSALSTAQTFPLLKGSGNNDYIRVSFGLPVSNDFFFNGGEFFIKPNVNLNITDRFISVSRTHKGR